MLNSWDPELDVPARADKLITHHSHLKSAVAIRIHFQVVDGFLLIHFNSLSTE